MRSRVVLVTLVVVAVTLAAAGGAWWLLRDRGSSYSDALDTLPAITQRATYTDWAGIRAQLDESDLQEFADAAYDADLSRTSAIENVAVSLDEHYGLSVRDLTWEAYGQSDDGAVDVLHLGEASFSRLRSTLARLGYDEPAKADGVWAGTPEIVAQVDPQLGAVQLNVVLLEEQRLLIFSDDAAYAERAAEVAAGDKESLLESVSDLADEAGEPLSAVLWAGDRACTSLAMSTADPADQAAADRLVDEAGGVSPLAGLVMARADDGHVTVGLRFENDDQAARNLQPRADLAKGDAPGLGGTFPERFTVVSGVSHDRLVVLDLKPAADEDALLSAISNGPVLFATC